MEAMNPELMHEIAYFVGVLGAVWLSNSRLKKELAETKKAVTNNHKINLRDDLDVKHNDVMSVLQNLAAKIAKLEKTDTAISEKLTIMKHLSDSRNRDIWEAINGMKEKYVIYREKAKRAKEE